MFQRFKLGLSYLIITAFFLAQHAFASRTWDFAVYSLNAQYLFLDGSFFELGRAPMASLLMGLFSPFGFPFAEYLYIVLVSALYLYAVVQLSRSLGLDSWLFYVLSLGYFVFWHAVLSGTEMLTLAFLMLFMASLFRGSLGGHWLGFAVLTRYPVVFFTPLLLFYRPWRNILVNGLLFLLPLAAWGQYLYLEYGNYFASLANSVALNIYSREYIADAIVWQNFWVMANVLLFVGAVGLYVFWEKRGSREWVQWRRRGWILLTFTLLFLYTAYSVKTNIPRYFYNFALPLTVFVVLAVQRFQAKKVAAALVIVSVIGVSMYSAGALASSGVDYQEMIDTLAVAEGCAVKSNVWVHLSYYGRTAEPYVGDVMVPYYIDDGFYFAFAKIGEPEYLYNETFMYQYTVVADTEDYIIIGDGCREERDASLSYLDRVQEAKDITSFGPETEACYVLFEEGLAYDLCLWLHKEKSLSS